MSAALVESVREALRIDVDVPCDGCKSLDLPAILAALTEAEALRARLGEQQRASVVSMNAKHEMWEQAIAERDRNADIVDALNKALAASQAMEVALREAMQDASERGDASELKHALSAPTDTAALRAMLLQYGEMVEESMRDGGQANLNQNATRVLGGS